MIWRPSATLERLRDRARLLTEIRDFFAEREVLEVETPSLSAAGTTELHLRSFVARPAGGEDAEDLDGPGRLWLQTSPELAMKRLLAAGSGPIFQIARVYRAGESGRRHNPEFTLLEWYRPDHDHHALMDEVEELLGRTLGDRIERAPAERLSYRELFDSYLDLDPAVASDTELAERVAEHLGGVPGATARTRLDRDDLLALLLSHEIEPRLPSDRLTFVYDFPASQASLARLRDDHAGPPVAERFEVWLGAVELANGFHELGDAAEQRRRFETDLERRRQRGLATPPIDERFLAALEAGLPRCSGVALGLDRLAMLRAGAASIAEILAFPIDRA